MSPEDGSKQVIALFVKHFETSEIYLPYIRHFSLSLEGVTLGEGDLTDQVDLQWIDRELEESSIAHAISARLHLNKLRDMGFTDFFIDPYARYDMHVISQEKFDVARMIGDTLILLDTSRVYTKSKEQIIQRIEELDDMGVLVISAHMTTFNRYNWRTKIESKKPFLYVNVGEKIAHFYMIDPRNE